MFNESLVAAEYFLKGAFPNRRPEIEVRRRLALVPGFSEKLAEFNERCALRRESVLKGLPEWERTVRSAAGNMSG